MQPLSGRDISNALRTCIIKNFDFFYLKYVNKTKSFLHEFYEYLIHFMNGLLLNQRCYYWDNVYSDKRGQTSCVILHEFYCVPLYFSTKCKTMYCCIASLWPVLHNE